MTERSNSLWQQGLMSLAWAAGLLLLGAAILDFIPEWSPDVALPATGLWLALPFLMTVRSASPESSEMSSRPSGRSAKRNVAAQHSPDLPDSRPALLWRSRGIDLGIVSLLAIVSWSQMIATIGFGPPIYHDEYSYLLEADLVARGRWTESSHSGLAPLFDQMHVLNEGHVASRYYPGTAFWLAPWDLVGQPVLGMGAAFLIVVWLVYAIGWELDSRLTAFLSAGLCAISPGITAFSTLLLSHLPALVGLGLFWWGILRWMRTAKPRDALIAAMGLSSAMLCRPGTAFAIGLPFGIYVFMRLLAPDHPSKNPAPGERPERTSWLTAVFRRWKTWLAFGLPLVAGWLVMLAYNHAVTGSWAQSPYQAYTAIYTPRHVFGFNNGEHGLEARGPKTIIPYDDWAENLTLRLAFLNLFKRLISSWMWSVDPILIAVALFLAPLVSVLRTSRWGLMLAGIVTLHVVHFPYWYAGIMNWHYVFESAPLWALFAGAILAWVLKTLWMQRRFVGAGGVSLFVALVLLAANISLPGTTPSRREDVAGSLMFPRRKYEALEAEIEKARDGKRILLVIEQAATEVSMDYVVNRGWADPPVLRCRYLPNIASIEDLRRAFPDRELWYCNTAADSPRLKRIAAGGAL